LSEGLKTLYDFPMTKPASHHWPVVAPYIEHRLVTGDDTDAFGHVNNVRYIDWAMDVAWAHSSALGLDFAAYERLGVGCVVWRHEFDYLAPVVPGADVAIATWVAQTDYRLRLTRAFEIRRESDSVVLFRGRTTFVTIDMTSGKPARMPKEFIMAYKPAEQEMG